MTRAELEQVRNHVAAVRGGLRHHDLCYPANCSCGTIVEANRADKAIAILDAELAKPEVREFRVCYVFGPKLNRDGFGEDGPWDDEVQATAVFNACLAMPEYFVEPELHSRVKGTPAGPWEPLEVKG